ncbi:MAG: DUF3604 domain-containing protein [Alphaproteobacteria bacterium]|nr:DUF3604 domain-containing protein [Alphaproteobacteria bacterium]
MMKMAGLIFIIGMFFPLSTYAQDGSHPTVSEKGVTAAGSASVTPNKGISGEYGTWTVSYIVGKKGIKTGGGIEVELPDAWDAGPRNSSVRLQTTNPADNNYITGKTSNPRVVIKTIVEGEQKGFLLKWDRPSIDGRTKRYAFVVRIVVTKGTLEKGDVISVVYGDRSGGSAGYLASAIATAPRPILIALDRNGDNHFKRLEKLPEITAVAGMAADIWVFLPSQAVVGQPVKGRIALVDENANAIDHAASFKIYQQSGSAEFPLKVTMAPHRGYVEFEVTPRHVGVLRLRVRSRDFPLEAISNPVVVTLKPPQEKIYWGDIHSHTGYSWDGVGGHNFYYARYIASLDFYAMTDHSFAPRARKGLTRGLFGSYTSKHPPAPGKGLSRGLNKTTWPKYTALTDRYNDPRHFVTLQAYEDSMGAPYGHRNVYFRNKPGVLVYPGQTTLPQLWTLLKKGDALTIPHHSGKMPIGIQFSIRNKDFQRNIEIYSGHGLSEQYDPANPLAFEHILFSADAKSVLPSYRQYAQDAWKMGLKLSTIASSDNHHAHPGQPQYGLAAVRAKTLTRNGIFQGLYDRMTYGTTGARIILNFHINGTPMGQTIRVKGVPDIRIKVIGTGALDWVELLRYQPGDKDFQVIRHWQLTGWSFEGAYRDKSFKPGAIYYVRVKQKYKIRRRIAMAWSSPIWTEKKKD